MSTPSAPTTPAPPADANNVPDAEALTPEAVRRLARLARLHVPEDELEPLTAELRRILRYMQRLCALDTAGVPPMTHGLELPPALRDDEPEGALAREEVLRSASDPDGEHVRVPQAVR